MKTDFHAPNKPAAPNAGIASPLAIGHRWPGVGEPERSARAGACHESGALGLGEAARADASSLALLPSVHTKATKDAKRFVRVVRVFRGYTSDRRGQAGSRDEFERAGRRVLG
jgi:hypothetical protein